MKIFLDTEFFENGQIIDLISIGLVREDGAIYYAETEVARVLANRSDWLRDNVLPKLTGEERIRAYIAKEIVDFVGDKPEFWADYASYDWVALCQLYGRMIDLPKGWPMFCRDVQQAADHLHLLGLMPDFPNPDEHNALADAKNCKEKHDWLMEQSP